MGAEQIDVAVRLGAVATMLLLAWLLFRQRREVGTPAVLFLPLAVCLSGFLIGNTPTPSLRLFGPAGEIAHLASGFAVPFLWWFSLACFDRRFSLKGWLLGAGIVWACLAAMDRGLFGVAPADLGLSRVQVAMGFAIVGHLVWRLVAERRGDLIQARHDARIVVAVLLGGLLLVDLTVDVIFGFAWRPFLFATLQNGAILSFCLWFSAKLLAVRPGVLTFDQEPVPQPLPSAAAGDPVNAALRQRLSILVERERIYLDPDLSFAAFVERMAAPEKTVRRLVNHDLGFDHFRTFLNDHRMAHARRMLAAPDHAGTKLIAIAHDSGFASLASFNRIFRETEGCTPSAYRNAALSADDGQPAPSQSPAMPGFEERSAVF